MSARPCDADLSFANGQVQELPRAPGDRVSASREPGDFVEIAYRNPKSGQLFRGWIRRDRLLDPAR